MVSLLYYLTLYAELGQQRGTDGAHADHTDGAGDRGRLRHDLRGSHREVITAAGRYVAKPRDHWLLARKASDFAV